MPEDFGVEFLKPRTDEARNLEHKSEDETHWCDNYYEVSKYYHRGKAQAATHHCFDVRLWRDTLQLSQYLTSNTQRSVRACSPILNDQFRNEEYSGELKILH